MRVVVEKLDASSLARVFGAAGAILGLVIGVILGLIIGIIGGQIGIAGYTVTFSARLVAVGTIVIACIGGLLLGVIVAFLYDLVRRFRVGPVEIEIDIPEFEFAIEGK